MEKEKLLTYCKKCLMPHTRPRQNFNSEGICGACDWNDIKENKIDWKPRWKELEALCDKFKKRNKGRHNVLVPYSGGKDGAYIAYTLKHKLGMNPLCVTIRPPLEEEIGKQNIQNFIQRGYEHVMITPNREIEKKIDKENFIKKGIPMHAFMISVQTAIYRASIIFDIPFVMFAEEGESEYGGDLSLRNKQTYSKEEGIKFYLSGVNPNDYLNKYKEDEIFWFTYPKESELNKKNTPELYHWSYFENFVNYNHYLVAKEQCGLLEKNERNQGSIENFSVTDTYLIRLYYYLMYLKFGFGRVSMDVTNEVRRGSMTRNQALNIAKKFDGEPPDDDHIKKYLEYYSMNENEFNEVIDKWANKDLFYKNNKNKWTSKFEIY